MSQHFPTVMCVFEKATTESAIRLGPSTNQQSVTGQTTYCPVTELCASCQKQQGECLHMRSESGTSERENSRLPEVLSKIRLLIHDEFIRRGHVP